MSGDKMKNKKSLGIIIIGGCLGIIIVLNLLYIRQCETLDKARQENLKYNGKLSMNGGYEFAVIRKDGSLYYVEGDSGYSKRYRRDEMVDWKDKKFIHVSIGPIGIFGLCEDGSIMGITGEAERVKMIEQEVVAWTNIKKIEVGYDYVLGLKEDGTVVVAGTSQMYPDLTEEVSEWKTIIDIKVADGGAIGLTKEGGIALAGVFGIADKGIEEIKAYDDIMDMAIAWNSIMVVHKNGKVSLAGVIRGTQRVPAWSNIVQVVSNEMFVASFYAGLKADGTVVVHGDFRGDVSQLKDIVYIDAQIGRAIVALDKNGILHTVDDPRNLTDEREEQDRLRIDGYNINQ